jgi:hypothetical protein
MKSQEPILKYSLFMIGLFFLFSFRFSKPKNLPSLVIEFNHFVGNDKLILDSLMYKNEFQQSYSISKFRYYISNIKLKRKDGTEYASSEYYLIDVEDKKSQQIVIQEQGNYSNISFTIGVDSLRNCSGLQKGTLDPVNGMFWAWNTGYIFLKCEGKSIYSKSPSNIFEYHIGGFKQPNNCLRQVSLDLSEKTIQVIEDDADLLSLSVDISEVFKTPKSIDFTVLSSVTDFNNATMMADNYADMFSVIKK